MFAPPPPVLTLKQITKLHHLISSRHVIYQLSAIKVNSITHTEWQAGKLKIYRWLIHIIRKSSIILPELENFAKYTSRRVTVNRLNIV